MENNNDVFMLGGHEFHSRFILGSGKYNSHLIRAAVEYADAEIVTLALRRANTRPEENIRRKKCRGSNPYRPPRP